MKFKTGVYALAATSFLVSAGFAKNAANEYEKAANSRRVTSAIYRDTGNIALEHLQDSYADLYDNSHDFQIKFTVLEIALAAGFGAVAISSIREGRRGPVQQAIPVQVTEENLN